MSELRKRRGETLSADVGSAPAGLSTAAEEPAAINTSPRGADEQQAERVALGENELDDSGCVNCVIGLMGTLFTFWALGYLYWHGKLLLAEVDGEVDGGDDAKLKSTSLEEPWYFSWFTKVHHDMAQQELDRALYQLGYRER